MCNNSTRTNILARLGEKQAADGPAEAESASRSAVCWSFLEEGW